MCGIVAAIAQHDIVPTLLQGLNRLEYRGYDSAGIALLNEVQELRRYRAAGKVSALSKQLTQSAVVHGMTAIAHTRWATHGVPSEDNAHPIVSHDQIAVVHNGIIENHRLLRQRLENLGYVFSSDTDTETIAHLVHYYREQGHDLLLAVRHAVSELRGTYALAILCSGEPERIIGVRLGSPLIVGIADDGHYLTSDFLALASVTRRFKVLEEGDIVDLGRTKADIFDGTGNAVERQQIITKNVDFTVTRGNHQHYMEKEIHEQPQAVYATMEGRLTDTKVLDEAFGTHAPEIFDSIKSIQIVACGTSYFAGLVARNWFEGLARLPCSIETASEFRYRHPIASKDCLIIAISQSGETADTLGALRQAKKLGYGPSLGIVNVPHSSVVRECDMALTTRAGPEIGVASTKAFTTQLTALLMLVASLGRRQGGVNPDLEKQLVEQLHTLPQVLTSVLQLEQRIIDLAARFANKQHALFLGRGVQYPVAMEGALKLKEVSYIHAEAYPAGELKHGPLALVDANMPVIAVAPNDELLSKLESNLEEVRARGGELYVLAGQNSHISHANRMHIIQMPDIRTVISPIAYVVPLQLLAYHVAKLKGTDIDQPRNLAKSVTVE